MELAVAAASPLGHSAASTRRSGEATWRLATWGGLAPDDAACVWQGGAAADEPVGGAAREQAIGGRAAGWRPRGDGSRWCVAGAAGGAGWELGEQQLGVGARACWFTGTGGAGGFPWAAGVAIAEAGEGVGRVCDHAPGVWRDASDAEERRDGKPAARLRCLPLRRRLRAINDQLQAQTTLLLQDGDLKRAEEIPIMKGGDVPNDAQAPSLLLTALAKQHHRAVLLLESAMQSVLVRKLARSCSESDCSVECCLFSTLASHRAVVDQLTGSLSSWTVDLDAWNKSSDPAKLVSSFQDLHASEQQQEKQHAAASDQGDSRLKGVATKLQELRSMSETITALAIAAQHEMISGDKALEQLVDSRDAMQSMVQQLQEAWDNYNSAVSAITSENGSPQDTSGDIGENDEDPEFKPAAVAVPSSDIPTAEDPTYTVIFTGTSTGDDDFDLQALLKQQGEHTPSTASPTPYFVRELRDVLAHRQAHARPGLTKQIDHDPPALPPPAGVSESRGSTPPPVNAMFSPPRSGRADSDYPAPVTKYAGQPVQSKVPVLADLREYIKWVLPLGGFFTVFCGFKCHKSHGGVCCQAVLDVPRAAHFQRPDSGQAHFVSVNECGKAARPQYIKFLCTRWRLLCRRSWALLAAPVTRAGGDIRAAWRPLYFQRSKRYVNVLILMWFSAAQAATFIGLGVNFDTHIGFFNCGATFTWVLLMMLLAGVRIKGEEGVGCRIPDRHLMSPLVAGALSFTAVVCASCALFMVFGTRFVTSSAFGYSLVFQFILLGWFTWDAACMFEVVAVDEFAYGVIYIYTDIVLSFLFSVAVAGVAIGFTSLMVLMFTSGVDGFDPSCCCNFDFNCCIICVQDSADRTATSSTGSRRARQHRWRGNRQQEVDARRDQQMERV
ncbi:unnamed protein product [Phytophthora fragariaefolia]|uniref:Unnamed protein product n=1 Tax=Phytophthora fragariaefolia TaxID=1490495 RepID=A0A9W6X766_9STRA|nr:unnamed protein product [Phytophthora fragariaefolia]